MSEGHAATRTGCALFDLSDRSFVRVEGADAADFLGRLLSYDVAKMPVGGAARAFLLEPRGKVIAAFRLLRTTRTCFVGECAPGGGQKALEALDAYHFGEDLALELEPPRTLLSLQGPRAAETLGALGAHPPEPGRHHAFTLEHHTVRVACTPRLDAPGYDLHGPAGGLDALMAAAIEAGATPASAADFEALRIEAGVPEAPHELGPESSPLEADALDGISEGKGCYPGQEVIERTLALGRPPRALVRLALDSTAQPGAVLRVDDADVGVLTSVAQRPDGTHLALALVKRKHAGATRFSLPEGATATPLGAS